MSEFKIDVRLCILLSVLLFFVPFPWLVAWFFAVVFHEMCHWLVVKLCGGNIRLFYVGISGASMHCADLNKWEYVFAILAGPFSGFILVLFGRWVPRLAICSWVLSVYNLLPVLPLDGGHAVRILIGRDRDFFLLEKIAIIIIVLFSLITCLTTNLGSLSMIILASLWLKRRKIPCKEAHCAVQ